MKKSNLFILFLTVILISGCCGFGGYLLASSTIGNSLNSSNTFDLSNATNSKLSVQEIVAKNADSVVEITTESVSTDWWMQQYITQGAGSGVIIKSNGYILTNDHVISGASKIQVKLHNGLSYPASLVATDVQNDIAVIKIHANDLTVATYGDSSKLSVGDLAVAIGNPLGQLGGTATCGIISALDRQLSLDGKTMTLLQTDASINPGNSGGGLFDQYGNLIGLVVAKSSGTDVEGLGFAIPSNTVKEVADQLMGKGTFKGKAAIGVTVTYLDADTAIMNGYQYSGIYIYDVVGKNAKKAGLKSGDYIYYIDNTRIENNTDLEAFLLNKKPGDIVSITVIRNDQTYETRVKLVDSSTL